MAYRGAACGQDDAVGAGSVPGPAEQQAPKAGSAKAVNGPHTFELGDFRLEGKQVLTAAKLVFSTRDQLNANKSNAILVAVPLRR